RAYLQLLLAGAGEGFKNNGPAFAATLKRFSPLAPDTQKIAQHLELRPANQKDPQPPENRPPKLAPSIHNFRLLMEALGGKDQQLAQLVDASNAVFATFAKEDASFRRTRDLLPGALQATGTNLTKLKIAANELGPTLTKLQPFAKALAPAQEASR